MMKKAFYTFFIIIFLPYASLFSQTASFKVDTTEGCGKLKVIFTNTSDNQGLDVSYTWDFNDGTTSHNVSVVHTYDTCGSFRPKLTLAYSTFRSTHDTLIFVRPKPNAYYKAESFCKKEKDSLRYVFSSVPQIVDSVKYDYNWTISPGKADSINMTGTRIENLFTATGPYKVRLRVSDYFGCVDTFTSLINVTNLFEVPKAFTPNGDGINDYFVVETNGRTVYSLKIFSSTGMLLYKNVSPTIMWDGNTTSGEKVLPGTYFYIIEPVQVSPGDEGDLQNKKAGFVVLVRNKGDMDNSKPIYRK